MNSMIKTGFFCLCIVVAGSFAAESAPDSTRTDLGQGSRAAGQLDNINGKVNDIHQALVASPLEGKNWGVELDPVLLLFTNSDLMMIFGTVSNFSFNRSVELAFPIAFVRVGAGDDPDAVTSFSVDAHYRYFLAGVQRGFYISGFARFQIEKFKTTTYTYDSLYNSTSSTESKSSNRLGIGFGIGDRIFSRKGWYWGWSLSMGRYVTGTGEASGLSGSFDDLIFDAELIKIGFAF